MGVTRRDRIRNQYIRRTVGVRCFVKKAIEVRLRWFGQVQRGDSGHIGRRMRRLEVADRRSGGRAKKRFMNLVKEDMKFAAVRKEGAEDRVRWRQMIGCGTSSSYYSQSISKDGIQAIY